MDDNQTAWHLLNWIVTGVTAIMGIVIKGIRDDQKELEEKHDAFKESIHKNYIPKDEFTRALNSMDRNFELINKKLDLLFIPKADK